MKPLASNARLLFLAVCMVLLAGDAQAAERELHWDSLDVDARLTADGVLDVTERHAMVFTGDWNGGERVFNVRPRQKLEFISMERIDESTGRAEPLRQTDRPNAVDEYTWAGAQTLRWRSRLPSDPPFASTRLIYVLHYKLSGVLLKEDSQYRLNHDFAFPNRPGSIVRFSLNLELDPAWKPVGEVQTHYNAGPLAPGTSFVLAIPLRNAGNVSPVAIDGSRSPAVLIATAAIVVIFPLIVLSFFFRERRLGRFAMIDAATIDTAWIEENIVAHPAEVVGAAWDGRVGASEVVALIARMTAEGKLDSEVDGKHSMTLRLIVDRHKLEGYERALIDALFFDDATVTSTKEVQRHYEGSGFNPATVIKSKLDKQVKRLLPPGNVPVGYLPGIALFVSGLGLLISAAFSDPVYIAGIIGGTFALAILAALLRIPGWLFRSRIQWGMQAAALLMIPAFCASFAAAAFIWFVAGTELPWAAIAAIAAWVLFLSNWSISGMKSRQSPGAIAFRKRLAAARSFFMKELEKPRPNLNDSWYPWLIAFGLGRQVDYWSSRNASATTTTDSLTSSGNTTDTSSSGAAAAPSWSGGGGLSGGGGATGMWAAAAAGMAAGVAAPGSSSTGGGSFSGSSDGGSSGGGGGGGW
jgi:uncharacterized membrane protein YgcG